MRSVRPEQEWDGYNHYYGRHGAESLPESITEATWERFFAPLEPGHGVVAEIDQGIVGIARKPINAVYESARAAGSSRVYWQTKASNAAGRALYDKLAEHAGFIVYAHEV
jgi:hypothetical protein